MNRTMLHLVTSYRDDTSRNAPSRDNWISPAVAAVAGVPPASCVLPWYTCVNVGPGAGGGVGYFVPGNVVAILAEEVEHRRVGAAEGGEDAEAGNTAGRHGHGGYLGVGEVLADEHRAHEGRACTMRYSPLGSMMAWCGCALPPVTV